jgi:hypothetical protein
MSHGIQFLANYTWSQSYDDMPQATRDSNTEDLNAGESYVYPLYPSNAVNIPAAAMVPDIKALDRGLSDINHPHAISLSYIWTPKINGADRLVRGVVNGWSTSGTFQHHSGDALTVYYGSTDNSDTGLLQDRAQENFSLAAFSKSKQGGGECPAGKSCETWFNNLAFSQPPNTGPGTGFGNVIKDTLPGPGYTIWNGALVRTFPVFRETKLEFRMEYFDVLNHTVLSNPSQSFGGNSTFGTITGEASGGPRVGQFALKYNF